MDRRAAGLTVLRICLGVFFVFEGLGKIHWFTNPSLLTNQLNGWAATVSAGSWSGRYLSSIALPYSRYLARLVPLGEITSGLALVLGIWTPGFAFVAFFMAFNFQFASGVMFKYGFLTSGYGLPVLGGTLALTLGGTRLPWSLRSAAPGRAARPPRSA